jgi:uncharacterized protein (TIGR02996 family)
MAERQRIRKDRPMQKQPDTAAGFLQAIRAEPDDDAHRLVFADWLEDHGDAERAEFIRLQIELDKMDQRETGYAERQERAQALKDAGLKRWLAKPTALRRYRERVTFRRGFPDWIKMSVEEFVRDGAAILEVHPVRKLWIDDGFFSFEKATALAAAPALARLEGLQLDYTGRCPRGALARLLASPYLTRLTSLEIKQLERPLACLRVLAAAPALAGLRHLGLQYNRLGPAGAEVLAQSKYLANLTSLDVGDTHLGDGGALALARSPFLGRLEHLDVSWKNRLTAAGVRALLTSRRLPSLKSVRLQKNPIGDAGARALVAWPGLKHATGFLDLADCGIGPEGAAALAACPHLERVIGLGLGDNPIGDAGARALAGATHLRRLRHLYLYEAGIGDAGVAALAQAAHLAGLTDLSLFVNRIGPDGAAALARSPYLRELVELNLASNEIGDTGAAALAASDIGRHLRELVLRSNDIGDAGAEALAGCPHLTGLTRLELSYNRIGAEGMFALARSTCLPRTLKLDLHYNAVPRGKQKKAEAALCKRFGARGRWL